MQRSRQPRRSGALTRSESPAFTLIELLVVIAIIAILAAILFPVFAQAREKARQTACLSNTKQMALAVMQYTQDFDETLPFGAYNCPTCPKPGGGTGYYPRWSELLQPYLKSAEIFICPSASEFKPAIMPQISGEPRNQGGGGYAANNNLFRFGNATTASRNLAEIKDAAGTFAIAETMQFLTAQVVGVDEATKWPTKAQSYGDYPNGNSSSDWNCVPPSTWPNASGTVTYNYGSCGDQYGSMCRRPIARHNLGLNVVYCDGHAKWSRVDQFLGPLPNGYAYGDPKNSWDNK